jgi:uncharacterized RDD family membrane protein YckC
MNCPNCGTENSEGARFCRGCGGNLGTGTATMGGGGAYAAVATPEYAGFWIRVIAYIIDAIVLNVVGGIVIVILSAIIGDNAILASSLIGLLFGWLYFAYLESSERQATLGKIALGMVVTDLDGRRISFGQATGRYFAKILSAIILLIGFIMVAFSAKKQGLHDKLANTLVIKRRT